VDPQRVRGFVDLVTHPTVRGVAEAVLGPDYLFVELAFDAPPAGYLKAMATKAVAASNEIVDDDGIRRPAGDVHAWTVGTNQSVCGLALSRSQLRRFPHVSWSEVYAVTGGYSDGVQRVCPRCAAAVGGPVQSRWTRRNPRP
jgi:hypothetical protein